MQEKNCCTKQTFARVLGYILLVILIGIITLITWSAIFDVGIFYIEERHKTVLGIVYYFKFFRLEQNNHKTRLSLLYTFSVYRIVFLIISVLYLLILDILTITKYSFSYIKLTI